MGMAIMSDDFTVADLDQFEGQNGRYELFEGALIVTPLGTSAHQSICLRLIMAIAPYVESRGLGVVFAPGRVVVDNRTALEPDLMVVAGPPALASTSWKDLPAPVLVVEVLSPSTRSFDRIQKRQAYLRGGAAEYWIVDPSKRTVTIVRADAPEAEAGNLLRWRPVGAAADFELAVASLFA